MNTGRTSKLCPRCREVLPSDRFYKSAARGDGLSASCIICSRADARVRSAKYRKEHGHSYPRWETKNRERARENNRRHYKKWSDKNRAKLSAKKSLDRAIRNKRTPKWLSEDHKKQILDFYNQAREITEREGVAYEVDHIHPLSGENFCGLHVPWNLQVIHHAKNRSKNNKPPEDEAHLFFEAKWNTTTRAYRAGSTLLGRIAKLFVPRKTGRCLSSLAAGRDVLLLFWLLKLSILGKKSTSTSWITGEVPTKRRIKLTLCWNVFSIFLRAMSPKVV